MTKTLTLDDIFDAYHELLEQGFRHTLPGQGMTRLVRFSYCDGIMTMFVGAVARITDKGRVIADAGGISVFQGIKLKRILGFDFNQVRPDWWVLLCFQEQAHIGQRLFLRRVAKLKRTLAKRRK